MADRENIRIKVSTQADTGALLRTIGATKGLNSQVNKLTRSFTKAAAAATAFSAALKSTGGSAMMMKAKLDKVDKLIIQFGKSLMSGVIKVLKLATLQMGIYGVAMMGVHALFVAGKFIIKAWNGTLAATAAVAAGTATAIGLVSAAVREQQAAMYAYKTKTHKEFGAGLNQTRMVMRSLQTDTQLASLGIETLNKAFGAVSKSGTVSFNAQSKSLLKGLMDFAAAGQPLEQGVEKAGELIAVLQDTKKSYAEVKTAAKALGPAMTEAIKKADKAGINTKAKFISALNSGQLSTMGGVQGQFAAVNNTLFSQAKGFFTQLRNMFGDFGQQFLEPAKVAFERMFKIVRNAFMATSGQLSAWGRRGGVLEFMVNATQKVSDFYVKLITEYLPKSEGMFKRIGMWWGRFTSGWKEVTRELKPLIDGARVLEGLFGRVFRPVWTEIKEATMNMNEMLQSNQQGLNKFADNLGKVLAMLVRFGGIVGEKIGNNMEFLSKVIEGIKQQLELLGSFLSGLSDMFGSRGAMQALMGIGRSAKTNIGGIVRMQTSRMDVAASSVSISGAIKGGIAGYKVGGPWGAAAGAAAGSGILGPDAARLAGIGGSAAALGTRSMGAGGAAGGGAIGLASVSGAATTAISGLASAASAAAYGLRSVAASGGGGGGGGPIPFSIPAGPSSPVPPTPPGTGPARKGKFRYTNFSLGYVRNLGEGFRESRTRGAFNARLFGGSYQDKLGREQQRKGILGGGMSSFGVSMGLSKLADRGPQELQAGLGLASMASMYSPTAGLILAGGTAATRSGNTALAAGGGALSGGMIGAKLGGAPGAIIGSALGFAMGAIMAPINKARIESKKIKAQIGEVMQDTLGELMVNAALMTRTRNGDSAIIQAVDKFGKKRGDLAAAATRGKADNRIGNRRSLMNMVLSGAGVGGAAGAAAGGTMGAIGGSVGFGLGAIPGAMAGAALVGAIGAVVGGMAGAIGYGLNQARDAFFGKNDRDEAIRKDQKSNLLNIYNNQDRYGLNISASQFKDMNKNDNTRRTALKQFEERGLADQAASTRLNTMAKNRMAVFTAMTGKTESEIDRLAQSIGLNLYDSTISMQDALDRLGITVKRTKEQVNAELAQMMTNNLSIFDQIAKRQKAPLIYDESIAAFGQSRRQQLKDNPNAQVDVGELGALISTVQEQMITLAGGDTAKAYFEFQKQFGEGTGALFNQKGGQLEGMSSQIYAPGSASRAAMTGFNQANLKAVKSSLGQSLTQKLAESNLMLDATSRRGILDKFGQMDIGQQEEFYNQVMSGQLTTGNFANNLANFGMTGINPLQKLEADAKEFMLSDLTEKESMVLDAQKKITEMQAKFYDPSSADRPGWWDKDALRTLFTEAGLIKGDTRTPRGDTTSSRLSQTLSKHASMNSLIAGKRSITSSYRTNNLGSINSDHVMGRAYDLVGNQLGMYKTTVERNGGFAEFHGGTLNRHLHVVPGPTGDATPRGGMPSPDPRTMATSSSGSSGNNYTINVYGAGTEEVVLKVKEHLSKLEREKKQRA